MQSKNNVLRYQNNPEQQDLFPDSNIQLRERRDFHTNFKNVALIQVVKLEHYPDFVLPGYETHGSAGMDLRAAVPEDEPVTLAPGQRAMIPTGLAFALPEGHEAQVRPRSGLAAKHGVTCLNAPGTIDSDYRGEVKVILINLGEEPFTVARGERIAQLVIAPVTRGAWRLVPTLDATHRGQGGFGSTGR